MVEVVILTMIKEVLADAIVKYAVWEVRRRVDSIGNSISQIVALVDSDGDGVGDTEQILCSFDVSIPDLSDGYCVVNRDDEIGLGLPKLELMDWDFVTSLFDGEPITGNGEYYRIDGDVYLPLDFDYSGDGIDDFAKVVDDNGDGIPDASDDSPFYPVGSDMFNQILESGGEGGKSLVVVSPDGTVCVYDENGQITDEDCETAYKIWVSDNNIMSKPLDWYTPTEGLLFLTFVVSLFGFFGSIFRRRKVM